MAVLDAVIQRRAEEAVKSLAGHARVRAAYIFGSWAEGRAGEWSDLDIAAFIEGLPSLGIRERARLVSSVQQEMGDDVEIHLMRAEDFEAPPAASMAQHVIANGVPINLQ